MAARWRPIAKMMSPFDSPTQILYKLSLEIFSLSLTVQKLFECIDLAGKFGILVPKFGILGGCDP